MFFTHGIRIINLYGLCMNPFRWGWVGGGDRAEIWDTALLYLIRSAKGEDMDVWIPCQPSELSYRCVILDESQFE